MSESYMQLSIYVHAIGCHDAELVSRKDHIDMQDFWMLWVL